MNKRTAVFAPLPLRAVSDTRLSALEMRVLAQIAYHDRLSGPRGQGRGCVASNVTLAAAVGCDYTRLSSAITALVDLGYVIREQGETDRRQRIYRVVHDSADSLPNGKVPHPLDSLPNRKPSAESSLPNGKSEPRDSLPPEPFRAGQPLDSTDVSKRNIFSETVIDGAEALRRDSVETASPRKIDATVTNVGAQLAQLERRVKRQLLAPHEVPVYEGRLQDIIDTTDIDDPNHGRAQRLLEELAA